ncbi:MAG: amidophosphoribosyltransferase [Firmicutes bacterium]|nr:amidophosphoribosyltransferase [Bacillota bacterium]
MTAYAERERPRDHCGIFAVYNCKGGYTAAEITYYGLLALQHRGQESAGMVLAGPEGLAAYRGMGLVAQVFSPKFLSGLKAHTALGHVRYSTTGESSLANVQPFLAAPASGDSIAIAHNGNLANASSLRRKLLAEGHIFHATADTEIMLAYLFRHRRLGLAEAVKKMMEMVEGAYAAVVMDSRRMVAFRDPFGFRPLCIGRLGEAWLFASETCALDAVGAAFVREVLPGEIVTVLDGEISSTSCASPGRSALCIFEYIYFSRSDSNWHGRNMHLVRKAVGAQLAKRINTSLDMVVPAPDSGISAAMGMAEAAGLPLEWAVHRNPYKGRTFINPTQESRELGAQLKYGAIADLLKGKKVALVDDSLVRGTTARQLTSLLRKAGAAEVHLFISAPPYLHPCYYGIDIPVAVELAAAASAPSQLAAQIGTDSLTFAGLNDLFAALGGDERDFCCACFTGTYPTTCDCQSLSCIPINGDT